MKHKIPSLFILSIFLSSIALTLCAEQENGQQLNKNETSTKLEPFTGKITKNRVRMRLQPSYDAAVLREYNKNDLVLVVGETDDFYAIKPPADFPGYVFRTYILDNIVEGHHVNVRLKPDLEAPIVAKLESGDKVEGSIAATNNKWYEIKLPSSARFYLAKDFIEKVGDSAYKAQYEKKREDVLQLLKTTESLSRAEMQKPFDQMMLDGIKANYQHIMYDFPEFQDLSNKAKEGFASLQEAYTNRRMEYLENQSRISSSTVEANKKLTAELQTHKAKISTLEDEIQKSREFSSNLSVAPSVKPAQLPVNMSAWIPVEEKLFKAWLDKHGQSNPHDFYEEQKAQSFVLRGIIDVYNRPVKNKPGDYILISSNSKLPTAFLYSTHINLQDYVGHEVSVIVVPRDNNNFAFPAYFVLAVQ